jgi:hypothetical protein
MRTRSERLARVLTAALALVCLLATGKAVDIVPRTEAFIAYKGHPIGERLAYAANLDFATQVKTNAAHAVTTTVQGFMTAADKVKLNAVGTAAPPGTRAINTTSPLQGGGDLSADRTLSLNSSALDTTISGLGFVKSAGTSNDVVVDTTATASIGTTAGGGASALTWTSAPSTMGGVTLANGSKFLLNGWGSALDGGVWQFTSFTAGGAASASRITGFTTGAQIRDARVLVLGGTRKGAVYAAAHPIARTIGDATLGKIYFKRIDSRAGADEVIRWSEDFTSSIATGTGFNPTTPVAFGFLNEATSGTAGAFATIDLTGAGLNTGNQRGIRLYRTGTTATGWAGIASGWGLSTTIADVGDSITLSNDLGFTRRWKVTIRQLSTGTQEYAAFATLCDTRVAGMKICANGIGWLYDRTSAVSTTNWLRSVRASGAGTPADTGVTAAVGTWHEFREDKYPGDDAVYLTEDGVLVQTVTSGLPTVGLATLVGSFASVGTTDKAGLAIDWDLGEIVTPAGRG